MKTVMHKQCVKCEKVLPASAFYADKTMTTGLRSSCKECMAAYSRARAEAGMAGGTKSPRQAKAAAIAARARYPQKYAARTKLNNFVRLGHIKRGPCEACGTTVRVHGHHDDHSKPLEVRWLCHKHHFEIHRKYGRVAV